MKSESTAPQMDPSAVPHAHKLLLGLWRQREELGLIAEELLELFQRHGLPAPDERDRRNDA